MVVVQRSAAEKTGKLTPSELKKEAVNLITELENT